MTYEKKNQHCWHITYLQENQEILEDMETCVTVQIQQGLDAEEQEE